MAQDGDRRAERVLRILEDQGKMLSAILIGNNIVNLSASSLATSFALKLFGSAGAGIATFILTFLVLIFGEISPKTTATIRAEKLSLRFSAIIEWLMTILTPVIYIVNKLSLIVLKILRVNPNEQDHALTEEELRTIVDVSHEDGVIESDEKQMIHNVFNFSDALAKEIMVPRVDMVSVSVDATYEDLLKCFREETFTRVPIFEETNDNIIGFVNMKDLLLIQDKDTFSIRSIIREPYYTHEHKNTAELLMDMKKTDVNIAIVLDEYGTAVGMITLEDLLEEIVGDIKDEYDAEEENEVRKLSETEYIVEGSYNLDDLCEMLDIHLVSEDYESIGGFIIGLLDTLPSEGESFQLENGIYLRVEKMDKNRIEYIYIRLPEMNNDSEGQTTS
jgi:CBS domain containing-hemolysin-like protein